jgi:hypothetical protein
MKTRAWRDGMRLRKHLILCCIILVSILKQRWSLKMLQEMLKFNVILYAGISKFSFQIDDRY